MSTASVAAKRFPFCLGTDITKLSRWEIGDDPMRIIGIANRVLHVNDWRHLKNAKPILHRILDPLPAPRKKDGKWEMSFSDFKEQLKKTVSSEAYQDLLTSTNRVAVRQHIAGRFAIKEAAKKAWNADKIGFKDLWIKIDYPDVQVFCLPRGAQEPVVGQASLSHDGDYCVATVIAEPLTEHIEAAIFRSLTTSSDSTTDADTFDTLSDKS